MDENSNQARRRPGLRRAGIAAAVGVGLTVGAAGIAAAATSPSPSAARGSAVMPDRHHAGQGGRMPGLPRALHGTLVVPKGTGTQTVDVQRGTVTAASATSLTVTSTDGFTRTYLLDAKTVVDAGRDTASAIRKGDEVGVVASAGRAMHVRDRTRLKASRKAWGPMGRDGGLRPGGPPPAAPVPGSQPGDFLPDSQPAGQPA